ncbi:hypothetical protein [Roseibium alexandrii]|jgi:hypothetical protein|uniref:Uncharacterized protein n=1 Tax=Roseibium alexandrii (strain DSM 17067 / NCIMB 14079 / DFL-11) TaxID=244592 RepID=A0A5E8GY43_ROSAD|nr:hypothetical protein [Roseibium alexandrii]EEE44693.2 hypothetical protein SADFL11_1981 [Roseibium alexandrii DFL-11]
MKLSVLLIPAAVLSLLTAANVAEARPDLRQMTCAQAQNMVQKTGAVVFTTGQYTYSRFVANLRYCDREKVLAPQYSATRDNPQCYVAYECKDPDLLFID